MKIAIAALAAALAVSGLAASASQAQEIRHDQREVRQDKRDLRQDKRDLRQDRHWKAGQRLDNRYGNYVVVNDWRSHRLPAPRRGYHWVRSGDDYVLAAVTGGLIASAIVAAGR